MKTITTLLGSFLLLSFCSNAQTGIGIPQMTNCDNMVTSFMATYNIPGATFALAKNGKLVYDRAFGNADISGNEVTQPYNLFRIASVSKPITAIAIMKMVENGQISLTDKVFGTGGVLENHPTLSNANITDPDIYNITIQNLLEHTAGWDRNVNCFANPTPPYPWYFSGCDPISVPLHVTQTNGTTNPATEEDMIVFLLEKGLDFPPNTAFSYSNIGYLVLGEIIEQVSNSTYENYVKDEILAPLGICDMHLGKNLLSNKMEREVEYTGSGNSTLSCYNAAQYAPWEYGGFNLEAMGAHGGWIATARDLVQLLVSVDGFSTKPDILNSATISTMTTPSSHNPNYAKGWAVNSYNNWWHTGEFDGTATVIARSSGGYTWAILLNAKVFGANANQFWADFDNLPWNCISATSSFPTHDLLDVPTVNSADLTFSALTDSSVTVSWTNGNGSNRILAIKKGDEINSFPLDGTSYTSNSSYSLGDDLGNNTYVVYDGLQNTVTVKNLDPTTEYVFRVFDYNRSTNTGNNKLYKLCGNSKATVTTAMVTSSTSLLDNQDGIKVYPTITSGTLNISLPQAEYATYHIYNTAGQLVIKGDLNCQECQINIASNLSSGLYWIKIDLERNGTSWKKFIIN